MVAKSVDVECAFHHDIAEGAVLDVLQRVLVECAPGWSGRVRGRSFGGDAVTVEMSRIGALADAVVALATEGLRPSDQRFGSAEFAGTGRGLTLVVGIHSDPLRGVGGKLTMSNGFTLQLRQARFEGQPVGVWAADCFRRLCEETSPTWGAVAPVGEYREKVMSKGPSLFAEGRDFNRWLPGLFGVNFLGAPYVPLLRSTPSMPGTGRCEAIGGGVLVTLEGDLFDWATPDRRAADERMIQALGPEMFWRSAVTGLAPAWRDSGEPEGAAVGGAVPDGVAGPSRVVGGFGRSVGGISSSGGADLAGGQEPGASVDGAGRLEVLGRVPEHRAQWDALVDLALSMAERVVLDGEDVLPMVVGFAVDRQEPVVLAAADHSSEAAVERLLERAREGMLSGEVTTAGVLHPRMLGSIGHAMPEGAAVWLLAPHEPDLMVILPYQRRRLRAPEFGDLVAFPVA